MSIETIEHDFKHKAREQLRLAAEGVDRYRVFTPFLLPDGDHLSIVLKKADHDRWVPGNGKLRFIEVKGRVAGAGTVTVTKNEILV